MSILLGVCGGASAERLALVIGNDDYANVPKLRKATGDAEAMKTALEKLGFAVTLAKNLDRDAFGGTLDAFAAEVDEGDEAILFYAGHGIALGGRNLLLPTDIDEPQPGQERRVERSSYDAGELVEAIREKKPKFVFAVLDACRNNPFEGVGRSVGLTRGLARMEAEPGSFILFSAGPGETALDRLGNDDQEPTSVFTRILLRHIGTPGLTLQGIAKATQRHVRDLALTVNHRQFPDYSDRMSDEPVLVAGSAAVPVDATWNRQAADTAIRLALLDRSPETLARILRDYPGHPRIGEVLNLLEAREDDAAFEKTTKADTIEAYEAYRRDWPKGRHLSSVGRALDILNGTLAFEALSVNRIEHGDSEFFDLAFSPVGHILASAGGDKSVKLWNLATGRLERFLVGHDDRISSVAFSPSGSIIASGSSDKTIKLWDPMSGRLLHTLSGHGDKITSVAFSPDGQFVASASDDRQIRLWNVETGQLARTLKRLAGDETKIEFSHEGNIIAASELFLWDWHSGKYIAPKYEDYAGKKYSVSLSKDGKLIASGVEGNSVKIWNTETGSIVKKTLISPHEKEISVLKFSPDNRILASGSYDRTIKLWDAATGGFIRALEGHSAPVNAIAFSPDGRLVATSARPSDTPLSLRPITQGDAEIRIWNSATGRLLARMHAFPGAEWVVIGLNSYVASNAARQHLRLSQGASQEFVSDAFIRRWQKESIPDLLATVEP